MHDHFCEVMSTLWTWHCIYTVLSLIQSLCIILQSTVIGLPPTHSYVHVTGEQRSHASRVHLPMGRQERKKAPFWIFRRPVSMESAFKWQFKWLTFNSSYNYKWHSSGIQLRLVQVAFKLHSTPHTVQVAFKWHSTPSSNGIHLLASGESSLSFPFFGLLQFVDQMVRSCCSLSEKKSVSASTSCHWASDWRSNFCC